MQKFCLSMCYPLCLHSFFPVWFNSFLTGSRCHRTKKPRLPKKWQTMNLRSALGNSEAWTLEPKVGWFEFWFVALIWDVLLSSTFTWFIFTFGIPTLFRQLSKCSKKKRMRRIIELIALRIHRNLFSQLQLLSNEPSTCTITISALSALYNGYLQTNSVAPDINEAKSLPKQQSNFSQA